MHIGEKDEFDLKYVLEPGVRVIIKKDPTESILNIDKELLNERLYVLNNFEKDGRIKLIHHLYGKNEKNAKNVAKSMYENYSESSVDVSLHKPYLRLTMGNLNFWVENYDFVIMPDGEIKIRQ